MIGAHQPGSEPIDIPETIPNPVVVPKPTPAPTEPAPKEPVRIPERIPERPLSRDNLHIVSGTGTVSYGDANCWSRSSVPPARHMVRNARRPARQRQGRGSFNLEPATGKRSPSRHR